MDDHVAAYLRRVKGEPPDFYQADGFECYYVEYVDVKGHDAAVGQESPGYASTVGQPEGYAVKYEEAGQSGQWKCQHVNHLRGEIHPFPVVKRAYTQKSYEEEELPYPERVSRQQDAYYRTHAEEKQTPRLAYASLDDGGYPQSEIYFYHCKNQRGRSDYD